jgi:tRNA/tmRNA/rRNA uracil-C5-methylase (TrmA/RlmC/RlmD family)
MTATSLPVDLIELEIGPVAHGGHCVARHESRVVFVRHTLPGERVRARLTDAEPKAKFWRADAVEVLRAAPGRVEAPCPLSGPGGCGGCDWQHVAPPVQRELKAAVLTEQLVRLAGLTPGADGVPEVVVEALPLPGGAEGPDDGPDDGLGWRTRVTFAVDAAGRPGLHPHRSHEVIPVEHCPIAHPRVNEVAVGSLAWRDVEVLDVVASPTGPDRLVVAEAARGKRADRLRLPRLEAPASVATMDAAVGDGGRARSGLHRVRGRTWVGEAVEVAGETRSFRVTGTGFWQVHPAAAQTLLDAVLSAARARPGERAIDLYAGVGLFAAGLAEAVGPAGAVFAVESDPRAVADARRSLHDLDQVRFEAGQVERVLAEFFPHRPAAGEPAAADVVVLDPPRSGAGRGVLERVTGMRPRVIVYVACDPAALARDLATAAAAGYRLAGLRAFDLFPMTHHLEAVATLVPE